MADPFPIELRARGGDGKRQRVYVIRCARCPTEDFAAAHMRALSEAHLTGTFQGRGWRVNPSGRHVCPACIAAETEARRAKHSQEPSAMSKSDMSKSDLSKSEKVSPAQPSAAPPAAVPSPAASSALVIAYMLLEEKYDKATKAYRAGYSDELVAKETGLSVAVVAKRREDDFGPLVVDTTVEDLRNEWDGFRSDIRALRTGAGQQSLLLKSLDEREARMARLLNTALDKAGLGALAAPAKAA
ncbi:MAG: hypothetical protein B7X99_13590 [Rhizobiales bacterium 17-65-6]|nr:MAG: hypothetical protein B7X99_13590 [Rhizobiales bacterium 17-65-6]